VHEIQLNDDALPTTVQSIKFMDDATLQEAVNLTSEVATNKDRSGPLPFWELGLKQPCGKVLPKNNSLLQNQIEIIKYLSDRREMALNTDKTCLFIVIFTFKHQFCHLLEIPGCDNLMDRLQSYLAFGLPTI
jgi:hypothetical protein